VRDIGENIAATLARATAIRSRSNVDIARIRVAEIEGLQAQARAELELATTEEERAKVAFRLIRLNEEKAKAETIVAKAAEESAKQVLQAAIAEEIRVRQSVSGAATAEAQAEGERQIANALAARIRAELTLAQLIARRQAAEARETVATARRIEAEKVISAPPPLFSQQELQRIQNDTAARIANLRARERLTQADIERIRMLEDLARADLSVARNEQERIAIEQRLLQIQQRIAQAEQRHALAVEEVARAERDAAREELTRIQFDASRATTPEQQAAARRSVAEATERLARAEERLISASRRRQQTDINLSQANAALSAGPTPAVNPLQQFLGLMGRGVAVANLFGAALLGLGFSFHQLAQRVRSAYEQSLEFIRAQFQLAVAVRASQRLYGDQIGSIDDWRESIERLRVQFKIFSEQELTQATALALALTRQFALTKEQTEQLVLASAVLAETYDRSVEDVLQQLVSFMQGQYGRALQTVGIDSNVRAVEAFAELTLGIQKGHEAWTEAEKGLIGFEFIMSKVNPQIEDAATFAETAAGQIRRFDASIQDNTKTIGAAFIPLMLGVRAIIAGLTLHLAKLSTDLRLALSQIIAASVAFEAFLRGRDHVEAFNRALLTTQAYLGLIPPLLDDTTQSFFGLSEEVTELLEQLNDVGPNIVTRISDIQNEFEQSRIEIQENFAQKSLQVEVDKNLKLQEAYQDYTEKVISINQDFDNRRADIEENFSERIQDINENLQERLADIERDGAERRADAIEDFNRRLEDIREDGAERLQDLIDDFNRKQARAEEDFNRERQEREEDLQRKIRDIREKYAIQIDEAVQKRDARAILNLQRRQNEEIRKAREDFDQKEKEEREDFERRRQREREDFELRRRELEEDIAKRELDLRESFERQLQELQKQLEKQRQEAAKAAARQRREASEARNRQLRDARENYDQQLREASTAFRNQESLIRREAENQTYILKNERDQQLRDLETNLQNQLTDLAQHYADSGAITRKGLETILRAYDEVYGLNGNIDQILDSFIERTKLRTTVTVEAERLIAPPVPNTSRGNRPLGGNVPVPMIPQAQGGIHIVDRPTAFLAGEAGRELAMFFPMNQLRTVQRGLGDGGTRRLEIAFNGRVVGVVDYGPRFQDEVARVIVDSMIRAGVFQ